LLDKDSLTKYYNIFSNSLLEFAEFFFPHLLEFNVPDFHKEIYSLLPSTERLVLAAPRGFAKSTISSVIYPLWLSLFGKRKDICIISASESLSIEWLRKIKREIEQNPKINAFWGDLKSDKWTESHIILNNNDKVNIRAKGAGGQIRGFRPDCVILDDIETDESVLSEDQRKKLKDWLFKACLNTLLPGGQFIVIGTLIHPLAVLSDLISMDNNWNKRKYRAYKDGRQEKGFELWPSLWSHEKLQQRKLEIGSFRFASEYMNDPVSDEAAPIKDNHIRYWKNMPAEYSGVIAVDPAYSDDDSADYKTASLIIMDNNYNRYLIHYIRTHAPIGEFQEAVLNMWLANRNFITAVGIPNSGVEKGFFESFLKKCDSKKVYPPIAELKNTFTNSQTQVSARNKKARIIAALQPLFEQGKYFIGADHIEARDELLTIGSSRWDDIVDTMSYAEQILTPSYGLNTGVDTKGEPQHAGDITNYGWGD